MGKMKGSGRRKKLIINEKSRSSDEETKSEPTKSEKPCKHIHKAVRSQTVENVLKHLRKGECKDCRGKPKVTEDLSIEEDLQQALSVCICLKCGYQGCSRSAVKQHAHSHFLKESQHSVCINTTSWVIWCYACDKEISNSSDSSQLQKTVKMIYDDMSKASYVDSGPTTYVSGNVKGLRNLGNTCFFNSVLQNISQTGVLVKRLDALCAMEEEVMVESEKLPKIELKVRKTSAIGPLTSALKCFLDDFHSSSRDTVAPSKLFGEITKKSPQFRGYRQQDSQELLRYLLDGMRVEELKRIEIGMKDAVKGVEYPPSKDQLRECVNSAKTFVDDVFGGSLVSTIICSQCRTKSQVHDNFLDLSLPVNTAPKESAKSAASKLLGSTLKNESKSVCEDEGPKEKKLSKHQLKAKLRKEKKAKRSKGKIGHNQKGSKEGSITGDGDDAKCNNEEEKDVGDGGRDESFESSKLSKEDGDVKSAGNMPENGCNTLCANFDSVEQFSVKDEAEFVIIDRISESRNDPNLIPKQAILGGGSLRPQNSNKSSLESLISGETSSLTSVRCVSSREDVSLDELSPRREIPLHADKKGAESDGISHTETYHDPRIQGDNRGLILEAVENGEDLKTTKAINNIATAFDSSLKLDDKVSDGEEREISTENGEDAVFETKEGEKQAVAQECRLDDKGGNEEDMEVKMKEQLERHLLESVKAEGKEEVIEEMKKDGTGTTCEERNEVLIEKDLQNMKKDDLLNEKATNASEEKDVGQDVKQFDTQQIIEEDHQRNTEDAQKMQGKAMPIMEIGGGLDTGIDDRQEAPMSGTNEVKMEDIRTGAKERTKELTQELGGSTDEVAGENSGEGINNENADSCDEGSTDVDSEQENDRDDIETVSHEYICKSGECSILSCLHQFTSKDVLEGNNKFRCEECTRKRKISSGDEKVKPVFTEATKQMLLWKAPHVLTLHLKRFEQVGRGLRKVNKHIEFPLELDLSPFCFKNSMVSYDNLQYSLHGIVEHSGNLHGGHYVAYVKTKTIDDKTKWYYISDSRVSEIQEEAVLRKQAYILFYHQKKQ